MNHLVLLNAMHRVKDIFPLNTDIKAEALPSLPQELRKLGEGDTARREVREHNHDKIVLQNSLADVEHVDLRGTKRVAGSGNNADLVFSDHSDNGFHIKISFQKLN